MPQLLGALAVVVAVLVGELWRRLRQRRRAGECVTPQWLNEHRTW